MVVILVYLSVMAALFFSGVFESAAYPNLYVRSSIAWMLMITAVGGVSFAFVAPLNWCMESWKEAKSGSVSHLKTPT